MNGLRVENLSTVVLGPVSLDVDAGELTLISGPSGSGKSLLLRAIADLDPHQGEVRLDGTARSAIPAPEWRRRVALLPAESFWWAEDVGGHFPDDHPLDTLAHLGFEPDVLDWEIARLSTGERQRLALARLLARTPDALLLDEATANLDPTNRERVETLVESERLERGLPVLWVSHDPEQRLRLGGRRLLIRERNLVDEP